MTELLQNIDTAVFFLINHNLANPLFDRFFVFITDVHNWYLLYVTLWAILFFKGGRKGKIAAVTALLVITASDQISSSLLKNMIGRVRPCNALENVRMLVGCTGSYSMPSSHAVNNFAIAAFFSLLYKEYKYVLYTVATLVALSRPYVGVHYPSDIVVGAAVGILIGYMFVVLLRKLNLIKE